MRVVKKIFLILWTLLLIGICTGCIMCYFFYQYITGTIMPSEKVQMNLETMPVNLSSKLYYQNNSTGEWVEWFTLQNTENREWVAYSDIPEDFVNAFVSIEDERFWEHPGIDVKRTVAAGLNFVTGKKVFGGSTITQQLVKNLSGDNEVTINRKITEICRALKLEETYSKAQILEWYMNIIYFGGGAYGIQAAADYYFNKDVKDLTLAEICSITGITNNPSLYNPYSFPENNQKRLRTILDKMLELGKITQTEHDTAYYQKLEFAEHSQQQKSGAVIYPYYVDAVIDDVIEYFRENAGVSKEQATNMLYYGGYNIYTCIDPRIQAILDNTYQNPDNIPKTTDGKQLQSAMTVLDPYSGDIVAMAGGVGEKKVSRGLNWASSRLARRPPGSSFKPIASYGPAMDQDLIGPNSYFMDSEDIRLTGTDWMPQNDSRKYYGPVTIHDAVTRSLNTISAQVMDLLKPAESYKFLTETLHMNLEPSDNDYAPLAVGQLSIGTTTREMASAYSIFPNMGVYKQGRTFCKITDHEGQTKYENEPVTEIAIKESTAYWMTKILQDAVSYGTGTSAKLKSMPAAGKTGTTTNSKDRWFAGYTPYYVGVVWTGYETPSAIHVSGNPAAKIWKQVMEQIHDGLEVKEFTTPMNIEMPGPKLPTIPEAVELPEDFDPSRYPPELYPEYYQSTIQDQENGESWEYEDPNTTQESSWWENIWQNTEQNPPSIIVTDPNSSINPQFPSYSDQNQVFIPITPTAPTEIIEPPPTEIIIPPEVQPGQAVDPWTMLPVS